MSSTCAVDTWLVPLDCDAETAPENLSPDEQLRAARFRFETDRARWIRSRLGLRAILGHCTGNPAHEIRFVTGPHGKPSVHESGGIEFSLSHSGCWAMVAVTSGVPVGVDIERIRSNVNMASVLKRLGEESRFDSQAQFFRAWTRREAITKAVGGALLEAPAGDFRHCYPEAPEGYCAALAVIGRDPVVRSRHLPT